MENNPIYNKKGFCKKDVFRKAPRCSPHKVGVKSVMVPDNEPLHIVKLSV